MSDKSPAGAIGLPNNEASIHEPARLTGVCGSFDAVVVGGGPAGLAVPMSATSAPAWRRGRRPVGRWIR